MLTITSQTIADLDQRWRWQLLAARKQVRAFSPLPLAVAMLWEVGLAKPQPMRAGLLRWRCSSSRESPLTRSFSFCSQLLRIWDIRQSGRVQDSLMHRI